jgi:hypothetical protein
MRDGDRDRADAGGEDDALQVGEAREAPKAPVQAEDQEDRRLKREHPRQRSPHVRELRFVQIEVEAQPIQANPGRRGGAHVVAERQPNPCVSTYFHQFPDCADVANDNRWTRKGAPKWRSSPP